LRCLWFQGIDPLTPRPLSPRGRGENVETRGAAPQGGLAGPARLAGASPGRTFDLGYYHGD
jgi:hypothetical protein